MSFLISTRCGTITESRSTKSGRGCFVPARVPQIMSCATNVLPHLGSRGPPSGTPDAERANFSGIARNVLFFARIFVRLPRLPMWIPAYSVLNRKNATALDAPPKRPRFKTAFDKTIDFFSFPDCLRTLFALVGPLRCSLITFRLSKTSVASRAVTFNLSILLIRLLMTFASCFGVLRLPNFRFP